MSDDEYKAARELEAKFHFYLTALAFTVLGLAIQTAPKSAPLVARVFELSAWTLLLVSGLLCLSFLEWLPVRRLSKAERDEVDEEIRLRNRRPSFAPGEAFERDSRYLGRVEDFELRRHRKSLIEGLEKSNKREHLKYKIARVCLVAGLISAAIARGYPFVQEIAGVAEPAQSQLILTTPN